MKDLASAFSPLWDMYSELLYPDDYTSNFRDKEHFLEWLFHPEVTLQDMETLLEAFRESEDYLLCSWIAEEINIIREEINNIKKEV